MIYSVVVTYNGRKWLDNCIGSLANSSVLNKIIVIDNGSSDGTPEIIHQKYPEAEIIEAHHNLGFGKANNLGLKKAYKAGADYIFLINQDAWVELDALEKLVNAAKYHPQYGIVSPVHLNGEGNLLDYGFFNCLRASKYTKDYLSDLYLKSKDEIAEIYPLDFVNGAFWLLPRKTIEIVGGFNPFFFQYGEDNDFVNRCRYFDLKIGLVPTAKAYHDRVQHDSENKKELMLRIPFLIKLFDPGDILTIDSYIRTLKISVIRSFLSLQLRQVNHFLVELMYYHSNKTKIIEIARKIKSEGMSFLD